MPDPLYLAPFDINETIALRPARNGGWIVESVSHDLRCMPQVLGAFSNTADMMSALQAALLPGVAHG